MLPASASCACLLRLSDFVFYSILVAQASQRGAMTAITSFIAILTGLCMTLFMVTVFRKALPALPISIVLGILFYVLTRYTISPFVNNLFPELLFH
jgi:presenilin 1